MPTVIAALVVAALLLFTSSVAEARRIALVVGNSEYDKIESLPNPQRDAGAIADRLRLIGFEVNEAFNTNLPGLKRATDRFLGDAATADLALFYFAGHGVQIFDRNYLLSKEVDAKRAKAADELGLDLYQFAERVRTSGATRILFIVDACRDNPFSFDETIALLQRIRAERSTPASAGETSGETRGVMRGLAGMALPPKGQAPKGQASKRNVGSDTGIQASTGEMMLFFAAQPGAVSQDGATASATNSPLVEGLIEELAKPSRPVSEILRGVSIFVRRVTSGAQVPQIVSDWSVDMALALQTKDPVRYSINVSSQKPLTADEEKLVIQASSMGYSVLDGEFLLKASIGSDAMMSADESDKASNLGVVGGVEIQADLDRDGRDETIVLARGPWNDPPLRLLIKFDSVFVRVPLCYGSGGSQMEVGLRDLNGDRRPEIWVTDGQTYCIYEFRGLKELAEWRRAHNDPVPKPAPPEAFRLLLSGSGTSGLVVSKDNTIKICTGTACHSPQIYKFEGGMFTALPAGTVLTPLQSIPFSDMAHRARIYYDHHLRQSIPLKMGEWRLVDGSTVDGQGRGSVNVTLSLGPDLKLTYRCANTGQSEQLLVTSAKHSKGIIIDVEDRAVRAATPLTIGSTACGVGDTYSDKGTHYLELAESTAEQCVRALAAGGKLTLPLVLDQKGLVQVALSPSRQLADARAACTGGSTVLPPIRAPAVAQRAPPDKSDLEGRISRFVSESYLSNDDGLTEQNLSTIYAKTIHYNGKTISREEHARSTLRYLRNWTKRDYRMVSDSLVVEPGSAKGTYDISFGFTFFAERKSGTARCGDGTVELTLLDAAGAFVISKVRDKATGRDC